MADAKVQLYNSEDEKLWPRTTLDNIGESVSSSTKLITSGGKILANYLDTETNITGAATVTRLAKPPTTSAVKEYVSSYVEEHAGVGTEVMAGVIMPEYSNHVAHVEVSYRETEDDYGNKWEGVTFPAEPEQGSDQHQVDHTSRGLGGHLLGTVQIHSAYKTDPTFPPRLYARIHHVNTEHEENVLLRGYFPDGISGSNRIEVNVSIPIPPNCEFEVVMQSGIADADYTLYFVPNVGIAVTGTTIQNTIVTDVE